METQENGLGNFFKNIFLPFFEEVKIRNQLNHLEKLENFVSGKYLGVSYNDCFNQVKNYLSFNRFYFYNFDKPLPIKKALLARYKEFLITEIIFYDILIKHDDFEFNEEILNQFLLLISYQTYISSYRIEQVNEINIYLDLSHRVLELLQDHQFTYYDEYIINIFKRCLYLTVHETRFEVTENNYYETIKLVMQDIEFSQEYSTVEHVTALVNYLNISIDHLTVGLNSEVTYIDIEVFDTYFDDYKNILPEFIEKHKTKSFSIFKVFSVFFRKELYDLKLRQKNKQIIDDKEKQKLLVQCTELINFFYGNIENYEIYFDDNHPDYMVEFVDVLKHYSQQITRILNENNLNIVEVLFLVSNFLSIFPEYMRLNMNIYKRIIFISKQYYYRKIYFLASILHLKSIFDIEVFKREIVNIKRNIEQRPVIALITLYNNEISSMYKLPPNLINYFKINSDIIRIHEKIYYITKLIFAKIRDFKSQIRADSKYKIKLEYLFNFQNEIKNILEIASDPSLVTDLGQFYSFFIDNYLKKRQMEYREDFVHKATLVKMTLFDINPLNFAVALLFSKLGKLDLIINHPDPTKLAIKKRMLTHVEKEQISQYIPLTSKMLPINEKLFNWNSIITAINNVRMLAISKKGIAPPDSRILKVIFAILNKMTRQDVTPQKMFPILYGETFSPVQKTWDLDPVLIFYFNTYFARIGKKVFYIENNGEKIEIKFASLNRSTIYESIYSFINHLLENTKIPSDDITYQLEEMSKDNYVPLTDPEGKRKSITRDQIKICVKNNRSLVFENDYVNLEDKIYLTEILHNVLTTLGKRKFAQTFNYVINELINNANKANLKRAHFHDKNVDMETKYEILMKNFLDSMNNKKLQYIRLVTFLGLKVKITYQIFDEKLIVHVSTNYKIHPQELEHINESIIRARSVRNLKEAGAMRVGDKLEGDGQGIIISILLMRKFGIDKKCFKLNIKDDETVFKIIIPFTLITDESEKKITAHIISEVKKIPAIPTHIQELKKVINDNESTIDDIEMLILKDPTLSADLIRTANTAYYKTSNPVKNVKDAVKIIGRRSVAAILAVSTSYKLLEDKTEIEKVNDIINHSERTAFYAKQLMRILKVKLNEDDIYIASLLHDIGKIVVESLNPDIYSEISDTIFARELPSNVIEDLACGLNHSEIGFYLSKRWKFPEFISEIIRYHHIPRQARAYIDEVFIVYLANTFTHYVSKKIAYENFDSNVLEYFHIKNRNAIDELSAELDDLYIKRGMQI